MLLVSSVGKRLWLEELRILAYTIVGVTSIDRLSWLLKFTFIGSFGLGTDASTIYGFDREVILRLGQDLYLQVRR